MVSNALTFSPTRRRRTPTVLQMESTECGPAVLASVLGYFGKRVTLEEVRVACGVSRDGSEVGDLLEVAGEFGLDGSVLSVLELDDLAKRKTPFIVHWGFNHYVVVEGFRRQHVQLNDPAVGPRSVTAAEFSRNFTGIVLALEPGPEFKKGGEKRSLWGALRERLRGSEVGLWYVILASLALAIVGLVTPIFSKVFVDHILVARRDEWIVPLFVGMVVGGILQAALTWLEGFYLLRLSTKLTITSAYKFLGHLFRLPTSFFAQRFRGEVGSRVAINDRLAELLSGDLPRTLLSVLMGGCYLALMLYYDIPLTLIALVVVALDLIALRAVSRWRKDMNVRILQEEGRLAGESMAGLQNIESVKASGAEQSFFGRWAGRLAHLVVTNQRMQVGSQLFQLIPVFLMTINTVAILGVGAFRVMSGEITLGTLVAFQIIVTGFVGPVNQLVGMGSKLHLVEGELNRLDDVLQHPRDVVFENDGATPSAKKLAGELELRNVTFGYNRNGPPLITGFNLHMKPGSRVALVGPTGSGKTTLAKLIAGLVQPWEGQIYFDGQPQIEHARTTVTNSVAMVDQDLFLCEGTVRDVLTMWDETMSPKDIMRAAQDACIHSEIMARPKGYAGPVEEGGRNFSRGQCQRLEIARVLAGNPSLLILDEATSALDPATEEKIDRNLRRRSCTCLIIAHRLSTIRDCDEIIVLDGGRVVQRGTHESLRAHQGLYKELIET